MWKKRWGNIAGMFLSILAEEAPQAHQLQIYSPGGRGIATEQTSDYQEGHPASENNPVNPMRETEAGRQASVVFVWAERV